VRLRGVGTDAKLNLDQADGDIEDVRGRTDARFNKSVATLRDLTGSLQTNSDNTDLTLERLGNTAQVRSNGGTVRLRDVAGTLDISGTPASVDLQGAYGAVTVNSGGREVRARDVRGPLTIQCAEGDIEVDQAPGAVNLVSANGRVRLTGTAKIARLTGDSVEVELSGTFDPVSEHFYTGRRSVDVTLPEGKYDLKVRAGGSVDSDFPYATIGRAGGIEPGTVAGGANAPINAEPDNPGFGTPPDPRLRPTPPPPLRPGNPGTTGAAAGRAGPRITINSDGDVEIREG
jgi:hypothetical protein